MCVCVCFIYDFISFIFLFFILLYIYIYIYIYSVSQKWVHPWCFCRYLSISLHGTTLTKWRFDTMRSVCNLYNRIDLFSPQNNSKYNHKKLNPSQKKMSTPLRNYTPKCPNWVLLVIFPPKCHVTHKCYLTHVLLGPCAEGAGVFKFVVQLSHSVILVTESSNMAPHGKEFSEDLKRHIVVLHEDG